MKRPTVCECGGRLCYTQSGSYVSSYCERCTPVVHVHHHQEVDINKITNGLVEMMQTRFAKSRRRA